MSHEVTKRADGSYEMAYVGETPWWGGGNKLEPGAPFDEWVKAAGFDFNIERAPVRFEVGEEVHTVPNKTVLYRSDNLYPLGVMSADKYHIHQPVQILSYFQRLADRLGFTLETAGTLYGGKQYWALARVDRGQALDKTGKDIINPFVLLATSADGSLATHGRFVLIRVVCKNTLQIGLGEDTTSAVRFCHNAEFDADKMDAGLGLNLRDRFSSTMDLLRSLGSLKISEAEMIKATLEVFTPSVFKQDEVLFSEVLSRRAVLGVNQLALKHDMIGNDLLEPGTVGAWLQSVTQYCDHHTRSRSSDAAANSALWGAGAKQKMRAFDTAQLIQNFGGVPVPNGSPFSQISDEELAAMAWSTAD